MFEEIVNIYESNSLFLGTFLFKFSLKNRKIELNKLIENKEIIIKNNKLEIKINKKDYLIIFLKEEKLNIFESLLKIKQFIENPERKLSNNLVELIFKYSLLQFINIKEDLYIIIMLHNTCLIEKIIEKLEPKLNFSYFKLKNDIPILLNILKKISKSIICNNNLRIILCNFLLLTIKKYDIIISLNGILSQSINIITLNLKDLIFCDEMLTSLIKNIKSKHIDLEIEILFEFLFKYNFKTNEYFLLLINLIKIYKKDFTSFLFRNNLINKLKSIKKFLIIEKDYLLFYEFLKQIGKIDSELCQIIFQNFSILFPLIKYLNYKSDICILKYEYISLILETNEKIDLKPINLNEKKTNRIKIIKQNIKNNEKIFKKYLYKFIILFEKLSEPPFIIFFINYLFTTNFIEFLFIKNYKILKIEFFKYKLLHNILLINSNIKIILNEKQILKQIKKLSIESKEYFKKKEFNLIVSLIENVIYELK